MKKILIVIMAMAMMMFYSDGATACPICPVGNGIAGIEINGSAGVGAQGYIGSSTTYNNSQSCFDSSKTHTRQGFIGVGIMSSADGAVCLKTIRNARGGISGTGSYRSGISGSFAIPCTGSNVSFYTHSRVCISGYSH